MIAINFILASYSIVNDLIKVNIVTQNLLCNPLNFLEKRVFNLDELIDQKVRALAFRTKAYSFIKDKPYESLIH
jgi:sensor domain CHASE-containing protein